jgi:hypothetical protein
MRSVYRVFAYVIALEVVIQAAAISFGFFGLVKWVDDGATLNKATMENEDTTFNGLAGLVIHGMNGMMVIPLLALVFLVVSFFAKIPGGVTWAALVFLAVVVQVALGLFAHALVGLGILHGANALVLFGLAVMAGKRVDTAVRTVTSPEAATV